MTTWSSIFPKGYALLDRQYFYEPGVYSAVAPAGTAYVRAAADGAGGFKDTGGDGWGGGSAYAFDQEACAPGATFSIQVGDTAFSRPSADTVAGDSYVKRADTSSLVYADRGRHSGSKGLAANSVGSVKHSGSDATANQGGASAGDDGDTRPMGLGGRGASVNVSAMPGGGGGRGVFGGATSVVPAGDGVVALEFYARNPGY